MFIKLSSFGESIVVNMDHVFDFHEDFVESEKAGSLLHFTNVVEPYGHRDGTHWKKHVDQSPDEILALLPGGSDA